MPYLVTSHVVRHYSNIISSKSWHGKDLFFVNSGLHICMISNGLITDFGILASNDSDHSRIRRLLNPAFSENALQQQEHILNHYFELLISKLRDKIRNSTAAAKVNLTHWYTFTTFDIISDLCFGESFEMLEKEEYDLWIANIFKGVKVVELFRILRVYPILGTPILYLLLNLPIVTKARRKHQQYSMDKVAKRLDSVTDRRDFLR